MSIQIGDFTLGSRVFIIAELSANHAHDKSVALQTVKAAKAAGVDAIKLQTYTPDTITIDSNKDYFKIKGGLWDGRVLYDLYKEAYTPWEWHKDIFDAASQEGLICFSSPFDKTAVDFLEQLNAPAYKIASFEIQDIPLIEYTASKGKPIIISTGIASKEDIQLAVDTCRAVGNNQIILLKCTSAYPAPVDLANMRTMTDMAQNFGVEVGLSDHTVENIVPIVAASLGARVIEKHFIVDRALGGPDADFSLDPQQFASMVKDVRMAEAALGSVTYELDEKVQRNRKFARSLFVVKDIKKGEVFTEDNVRSIRPGYGMHPKHLKEVLGTAASQDISRGEPLRPEHLSKKY